MRQSPLHGVVVLLLGLHGCKAPGTCASITTADGSPEGSRITKCCDDNKPADPKSWGEPAPAYELPTDACCKTEDHGAMIVCLRAEAAAQEQVAAQKAALLELAGPVSTAHAEAAALRAENAALQRENAALKREQAQRATVDAEGATVDAEGATLASDAEGATVDGDGATLASDAEGATVEGDGATLGPDAEGVTIDAGGAMGAALASDLRAHATGAGAPGAGRAAPASDVRAHAPELQEPRRFRTEAAAGGEPELERALSEEAA